jgi:L-alanine-DL-glutamate epimerase-like enolase superfamily enzyme
MKQFGLRWYEEPVDPLDYFDLAAVAENYPLPLATGENLFSFEDLRNLIRHGGLRNDRDYIQMDCPLSYGLVEYMRVLDYLGDCGWSSRRCIPHGGHQFCANIAAGLNLGGNENYPGVFQPFGGFADNIPVEKGCVTLPDVPGIGFELKANLWTVFKDIF